MESLERELDAAISAAARARSEKRQAEAAQKAAELRAHEVTKELENTTSEFELWTQNHLNGITIYGLTEFLLIFFLLGFVEVFGLHMEELRAKQEEIGKRDKDIKLLEAIIQTLGGTEPRNSPSS